MEQVTSIGLVLGLSMLVIVFIILFIIYIMLNTIRNENKRKDYSSVMKEGDEVYIHVRDYVDGEVVEVNGDDVKILVRTNKSKVYPR